MKTLSEIVLQLLLFFSFPILLYSQADIDIIQEPGLIGCDPAVMEWAIDKEDTIDSYLIFNPLTHRLDSIIWFQTDSFTLLGTPDLTFDTIVQTNNLELIYVMAEDYYDQGRPALGNIFMTPLKTFNGAGDLIKHAYRYANGDSFQIEELTLVPYGQIVSGVISQDTSIHSPSSACDNNHSISYFIERNLIIDVDYCFKGQWNNPPNFGELIFAPNTSLIIQPGIVLQIDNMLLDACSGTWNQIEVMEGAVLIITNSLIRNANRAILMHEGAEVQLFNTTIEHVQNGIHSEQGSFLYIKGSTIENPVDFGRGEIGVQMFNNEFMRMESSHVENFQVGVRAFRSDINVSTSSFHNMEAGNASIDGRGIEAYGDRSNYALIEGSVGLTGSPVNFSDCETGIFALGIGVEIVQNTMSGVNIGIDLNTTSNKLQQIKENEISSREFGILLTDNSGIQGEVFNNNITIESGAGNPSETACIKMINSVSWTVSDNTLDIDQGGNGIIGQNNRFPLYKENLVITPSQRSADGFEIESDYYPRLRCNEVLGSDSRISTQQGFLLSRNRIYNAICNTVSNVDNGFYFGPVNTGMNRFKGNSLAGVNGIWIESEGMSDQQFNQGNCFDGSQATNKSSRPVELSAFLYNNDTQQGGDTCFYPVYVDGPSGWFVPRIDPEYYCSTSGVSCNTPDTSVDPDVCFSSGYISALQDSSGWTYDPGAQQFYQELAIYQAVKMAECDSIAPELDSLLDAHSGDMWDVFVQIEDTLSATHAVHNQADSLLKGFQIARYSWYDSLAVIYLDSNGMDSVALNFVLNEIHILDSLINIQKNQSAFAAANRKLHLNNLLQSVTPVDIHETRLKNVHSIYIKTLWVDSSTTIISSQDSTYLDSIAQMCIYSTGFAGSLARASLYRLDPYRVFSDSVCFPIALLEGKEPSDKSETVDKQVIAGEIGSLAYLTPNPVEDLTSLVYSGTLPAEMWLYDLSGKLILQGPLVHGTNSISTAGLPSGIFILQITGSEGIITTLKLVK